MSLASVISAIGNNLSALAPPEILRVLRDWSKEPASVIEEAINAADPKAVRELAQFLGGLAEKVNSIGKYNLDRINEELTPLLSDDFFAVMDASKPVIPEVKWDQINKASADITTAIKSENWTKALQVGIGLASGVVPGL